MTNDICLTFGRFHFLGQIRHFMSARGWSI
jgi:hypothetical protein